MAVKLWPFLLIGLIVVAFKSAGGATTFSLPRKTPDRDCKPVKRDLLRQRLGTAYNHRYMAMDSTDLQNHLPPQNQYHVTKRNITKRSSSLTVEQITDPAPWTCQTSKVWINLGPKFFPRHVRSVTCSSDKCWFNHFRCRPKYYTIKVLKKKEGQCLRVFSSTGKPRFEDYWEPKDYRITVDCECGY
ncbi:protein trunk-like isoform X6 [Stylophora pistillata]|uniref:Protein trunk n=1 Tax=Stylophora pistillata TaxID=50429 RepID=A0A2B4SQY1_STYPI|nr:protein trunk-like isoform X6 [Stylophora pistillata]PFX31008.1 Protein trunk [Stylophora pistillata]